MKRPFASVVLHEKAAHLRIVKVPGLCVSGLGPRTLSVVPGSAAHVRKCRPEQLFEAFRALQNITPVLQWGDHAPQRARRISVEEQQQEEDVGNYKSVSRSCLAQKKKDWQTMKSQEESLPSLVLWRLPMPAAVGLQDCWFADLCDLHRVK